MRGPWKKFEMSEGMLAALEQKTRRKEEIFSFRSDPQLASLISCLGLQFELGKPDQDRLSFLLGVDLSKEKENPWQSEIVSLGDQLGLRAWIPGLRELRPLHEDFRVILHPLSLSREGMLDQVLIFPGLVAEAFATRGIELVVVRDWALSAFLSRNLNLNYQKTNRQEIEENITLTQVKLMRGRQLALTGTHDIADHLLGGRVSGIESAYPLLERLDAVFEKAFRAGGAKNSSLVISYLIAVLLDDLVQPQWYASPAHLHLGEKALSLMLAMLQKEYLPEIFLPQSFHELVNAVRNRDSTIQILDEGFERFAADLQCGSLMIPASARPAQAVSPSVS